MRLDDALAGLLRRERPLITGALVLLVLVSWWYLATGAGTGMNSGAMSTTAFPPWRARPFDTGAGEGWTLAHWLVMIVMWWVMMIAMMLPSAIPVILLHHRVTARAAKDGRGGLGSTVDFTAGYLAVWFVFAVAATWAECLLEDSGVVSSHFMWSRSAMLSGGLLIAAGLYQLTPLKRMCLSHCRSPAEVLAQGFRPGRGGAFRMGIAHGAWCVGCCWALMLLLFVGGAMNLVWIAGLTVLVAIEKLFPGGPLVARGVGVAAIALGAALIVGWLA